MIQFDEHIFQMGWNYKLVNHKAIQMPNQIVGWRVHGMVYKIFGGKLVPPSNYHAPQNVERSSG